MKKTYLSSDSFFFVNGNTSTRKNSKTLTQIPKENIVKVQLSQIGSRNEKREKMGKISTLIVVDY